MKTCLLPKSCRPEHRFRAFFLCAALLGIFTPLFAQKITAVAGVSLTVEDLEGETRFFTEILGFEKTGETHWKGPAVAAVFGWTDTAISAQVAELRLGAETIRLIDFEGLESRPAPADTRSNDLWFQHLALVVGDMDAAYQKLLAAGVAHVSTAPQTLPDYLPNAAGIRAFYFRDPEGHNLELIWFPPGKGQVKWQAAAGRQKGPLFLGIDHTAIAVSNTQKSMAFYRDALGLTHGGHSENFGTEQEHLNQVFGARLDINGLHAGAGMGVEFLRYIAPPGGRPFPAGSTPADLWHYHTELLTDNLAGLSKRLEAAGYTKVSTGVAQLEGAPCLLLRDPDGHAVLLREGI